VTGRGILHPCPVCQDPTRQCGHTSADIRAFYQQTHELKKIASLVTDAPRKHHKVKPSGPEVFPASECTPFALVPMNGKLIRVRTAEVPPIKTVDDDGYAGGPRKDKA
jgi:hypothetical protein